VIYSIDKYNQYVRASGGMFGIGACSQTQRKNRATEMTDDAMLYMFLTTPENELWNGDMLFHFIQDIVCYLCESV
jgi:hypothetical protein